MTHLGISKFLPLQEAGLRTSMSLTYNTRESGPDILDFSPSWSFSKNFLNFLTAVRTQDSSRRALPGIATAPVPRALWGDTGSHLQ